jgi:hypothetical protein
MLAVPARPEEVGRSKESGVLNDMIAEINAPILARLFDKESAQDGQAKPNPVAAIKPPTLPGATTQGITPAMGKLGSAAPANPPKSLLSRLLKAADTQTSALRRGKRLHDGAGGDLLPPRKTLVIAGAGAGYLTGGSMGVDPSLAAYLQAPAPHLANMTPQAVRPAVASGLRGVGELRGDQSVRDITHLSDSLKRVSRDQSSTPRLPR